MTPGDEPKCGKAQSPCKNATPHKRKIVATSAVGHEFTGMIIIRFFDHYRPLLVPQVWWFEYYKPNESADLAGGLGKEN